MSQTTPVGRSTPDHELARLLDRAAGALSHSHPELAAELTTRAGPEHEPPDPFHGLTGDVEVDWFRTFGYLMLRGMFERDLVEELRAEVVRTMLGVHGDRYDERPPMSGMAGHETCLLGPWAPRTVELIDSRALVGLAERLVGGGVLPSPCDTQGILYFDHAGWHNDTGIGIRGVKFVAYLEPVDGNSGALRVLPGSHRSPDDAIRHLYSLDLAVPDVPGQVLSTEPGDVIAFDPLLYHAVVGRPRSSPVVDAVCPRRHHTVVAAGRARLVRGRRVVRRGTPPRLAALRPSLGGRGLGRHRRSGYGPAAPLDVPIQWSRRSRPVRRGRRLPALTTGGHPPAFARAQVRQRPLFVLRGPPVETRRLLRALRSAMRPHCP